MRINPAPTLDWGSEIRHFRRLRAIKQTTLAEMLGVDQATVSRWEGNRQTPDLGMQRRLQALMHGDGAHDEILLRHWVGTAIGDTALLDASRNLVVGSASFLARHGIEVPAPPGLPATRMFSEELDRAWRHAAEHGFFEGDVASVTVIGRVHLLSGDGTLACRSVWLPAPLNDGRVLCRMDIVTLNQADFDRSKPNTIELVTMSDLGG